MDAFLPRRMFILPFRIIIKNVVKLSCVAIKALKLRKDCTLKAHDTFFINLNEGNNNYKRITVPMLLGVLGNAASDFHLSLLHFRRAPIKKNSPVKRRDNDTRTERVSVPGNRSGRNSQH